MRRYENYRNIRRRALIYGLPLLLFALQMISVIGSLLVIIFSFSLPVIISALAGNLVLYFSLLKFSHKPGLLHFRKVFPSMISNKRISGWNYED